MGRARRPDVPKGLHVISVAAGLAGVHPQTLRFYERRGLVTPARTAGGNRRYSEGDIERLRRIQQLTNEGVSLAGVERVLELEDRLERARAEIGRLRRAVDALATEQRRAVDEVHRQYRRDLVPVSEAGLPFGRRGARW